MKVERANTIFFKKIQFKDEDGVVAACDTVTLTLRYKANGSWTETAVTLSYSDPYWSGSWDSSVADAPQQVYCHLEGVRNSPALKVVRDFFIRLTSNPANEAHHD